MSNALVKKYIQLIDNLKTPYIYKLIAHLLHVFQKDCRRDNIMHSAKKHINKKRNLCV
jgi:hypothetical protein